MPKSWQKCRIWCPLHASFANCQFWAKKSSKRSLHKISALWLFFFTFLVFVVANLVITAHCIRPKFLNMAKKNQQKCILTLLEQWLLLIIRDLPSYFLFSNNLFLIMFSCYIKGTWNQNSTELNRFLSLTNFWDH